MTAAIKRQSTETAPGRMLRGGSFDTLKGKRMKAVLFFDVDLTLTDSVKHEVPQSTVRAILAAQANGHLCFVNTGRAFTHIDPCVRAIPFDGFVCGCGVQLRLREPDGSYRIDYDVHPEKNVRDALLFAARRDRIPLIMEDDTCMGFDPEVPAGAGWMKEQERLHKMGVPEVKDVFAPDFTFAKFLVDKGDTPERLALLGQIDRDFGRVDRGDFYECVPKGCTKGTGLARVMELYGEGRRSFAFGDSTNDLEMLSHADVAVVMGNGTESVKEKADFVTKAIDEDGIEFALRYFGLIG